MFDPLDPYSGDVGPFDDDDDYGDIPWADPQIKKDYEAALGRLILAHNNVDIHLTRLIRCVLKQLGDPEPLAKMAVGRFADRLENVRMLGAITKDTRLTNVPFVEIAKLNGLRNIVAHGHFEQNPFDGAYELIGNKRTHTDFSIDRLNEIADELTQRGSHLDAMVTFWDVSIILPEDAPPVNPDDPRIVKS
jgi:hypothetical protein